MKKLFALICVAAMLLCAACAQTQQTLTAADETPVAVTPQPTEAPTPEPTPEPTPSPTPEPQVDEQSLSQQLIRRKELEVTVTALRFSPGYCAEADLSVTNLTTKDLTIALPAHVIYGVDENGENQILQRGATLNDWTVSAELSGGEKIASGETRACTLAIQGMDTELFSRMEINSLNTLGFTLSLIQSDSGRELGSYDALIENPSRDLSQADAFAEDGEVLLDNRNVTVKLLGADESFSSIRLYLEKKETGSFTTVSIDPMFGGYTNVVNPKISMYKQSRMLYDIDGTQIMAGHGIERLSDMDVYLTFEYANKIDRPVKLSIKNPTYTDSVMSTLSEDLPILYQDKYCVLKNLGVNSEAMGRDVILFDYENITQTYIKMLDLTVQPAYGFMSVDGTEYPIGTYCTYSYPYTHGYMMIWPVGAPEGTLSSAKEATMKLYITRIHSGHYDPVSGTGEMTVDLHPNG